MWSSKLTLKNNETENKSNFNNSILKQKPLRNIWTIYKVKTRKFNKYLEIRWILPNVQMKTISSSVALFSFCVHSFPEPASFLLSQLFTSDGQSVGASATASVFPKSIQGWFLLRFTIHTLSEFTRLKRNSWECEVPMSFQRSDSGIYLISYLVYMCILFESSVLIPRVYPKEDMLYESL